MFFVVYLGQSRAKSSDLEQFVVKPGLFSDDFAIKYDQFY